MAVTSESQIYNTTNANTIATYLTNTLSEVNKAKDNLTLGGQYCAPDYFSIDGRSEPQEKIDEILNQDIGQLITKIPVIKSQVLAAAEALKKEDQKAYNDYVEQKRKEEEERKAAEEKAREDKLRQDEERNHGLEPPIASPLPYTGSSSQETARYL